MNTMKIMLALSLTAFSLHGCKYKDWCGDWYPYIENPTNTPNSPRGMPQPMPKMQKPPLNSTQQRRVDALLKQVNPVKK